MEEFDVIFDTVFCFCNVVGLWDVLKVGRIVHSPLGVRLPCKTCSPLYLMMAACWSKCAVQLLLQSCPMDTRGFCNFGKMCTLVAVVGSIVLLIGSCAVWDD